MSDEHEDDEDTGPIRLWPALVALGVTAVLAVAAIVVVVSDGGLDADDPAAGTEVPMPIAFVAPGGEGLVRLIVDGACHDPLRATAVLGADAISFSVAGRDPGGGCATAADLECVAVTLSQAVGPRAVLPRPDPARRAAAERIVTTEGCAEIPVEEG